MGHAQSEALSSPRQLCWIGVGVRSASAPHAIAEGGSAVQPSAPRRHGARKRPVREPRWRRLGPAHCWLIRDFFAYTRRMPPDHSARRGAVSRKLDQISASGIRRFFETEGVITLGVGQPDFVAPNAIRQAAIKSLEDG